jgi:hypothetical protein
MWSNSTLLKYYNPCSAFVKYWKGAQELVVVVDRGNKDGNLIFSPDPLFGLWRKNKRGALKFGVWILSRKLYDKL